MTDEQIEQNAEKYAKTHAMDMRDLDILKRAHSNGAHSRDEEIAILTQKYSDAVCIAHSRDEEIEKLRKHDALENKMRIDLINECEKLKQELNQLRNPWISVEERLPDKKKSEDGVELTESEEVFVRTEKVYYGKMYMYYGVAKCFYPTCGGHEWSVSDVTHWMPIPELKKGE